MSTLALCGALAALGLFGLGACTVTAGRVPHIVAAKDSRAVVARTEQGLVQGATSAAGTAYLGIPFAAPPVGDRRFAPPQPVAAWPGTRMAIEVGPACPQTFSGKSEDCLYLNVYAPSDIAPTDRLPVMVWIHGGSLSLGSNGMTDGSRIAERQRVILVSPNYRLGAPGFFAHPALRGEGEGNYGILDQRAALTWVQRNIANFGGDPARVTLFGESAGATSACTHMASPGSRGLFHRVILQSDTCIFPEQSIGRDAAERGGVAMARELGCTDDATVVACLRAVPIKRLLKAKAGRWGNRGADSWSPLVGGDVLPRFPRDVFADGGAASVPLLMGSNRDEGRLFSNLLALTGAWTSQRRYERAVAEFVHPDVRDAALAEYADTARRSRYHAFADMLTDSKFACPMLTLHRMRGGRAPDFVYEFDDSDAPRVLPTVPFLPRQGAYHASELLYVFQHRLGFANPADWTPAQRALSDRMQRHWGAFAWNGTPNAAGVPPWPMFDGARPVRLAPEGPGLVEDFAVRHRCAFWNARGY